MRKYDGKDLKLPVLNFYPFYESTQKLGCHLNAYNYNSAFNQIRISYRTVSVRISIHQ